MEWRKRSRDTRLYIDAGKPKQLIRSKLHAAKPKEFIKNYMAKVLDLGQREGSPKTSTMFFFFLRPLSFSFL